MSLELWTAAQAAEQTGRSKIAVLTWYRSGRLKPAEYRGRQPLFLPGQVISLVTGCCPICGKTYPKGTLKQRHCSQRCRQAANRLAKRNADEPVSEGANGYPTTPAPAPARVSDGGELGASEGGKFTPAQSALGEPVESEVRADSKVPTADDSDEPYAELDERLRELEREMSATAKRYGVDV